MFRKYNANPGGEYVGDCVIRALSAALRLDWYSVYIGVVTEGMRLHNMPSANHVWGSYLRREGFERHLAPEGETVADFALDHPVGTYILATAGHVVALIDGDWYDTWDSADEIPLYYWKRR